MKSKVKHKFSCLIYVGCDCELDESLDDLKKELQNLKEKIEEFEEELDNV